MHDLHTHSNYSDGILSPTELVSRAHLAGITHLALTDHDTLVGLAEAEAAASQLGVKLIAGIELSCAWQGRGIHIVGLHVDAKSSVLQNAVAQQAQRRIQRGELIDERLAKVGIKDILVDAQRFAGNAEVARPHFARALIERGIVKDMNAAFKRYLGSGKPGDVKQFWPDLEVVVGWILAAGGVPVIAHPDKYDLTRTKLNALISDFVDVGGLAIEVISGKQDVQKTQNLLQLAQQHNLSVSLGSDFHVPGQPWQELGCAGDLPAACKSQPVWQLWE